MLSVLIHGQYVLTFAVTPVWYMGPDLVLCEQLLLKLPADVASGGGNPFPVIEQLAKDMGCKSIILSDALGSGETLGRLYQRGGYARIASDYIKEVPWE